MNQATISHRGFKRWITRHSLVIVGLWLEVASPLCAQAPSISSSDDSVSLFNEQVRLDFSLATGRYRILSDGGQHEVISQAKMRVNDWSSDDDGLDRSWRQREIDVSGGKALVLELSFRATDRPEMVFHFTLEDGRHDFSVSGGIVNSGRQAVQVREIHVMADALVHDATDKTRGFAMIDGFSGGEPLEYGDRSYSPLTRANALKSRNNILLTFRDKTQQRVLVMGGLTYQDFEKFAWITQARRDELRLSGDGKASLLAYLDLPKMKIDRAVGGESLELIQGAGEVTWHGHEFRCREMATSVDEPERIVVAVAKLQADRPYTLGFSWWRSFQHGKYPDLAQSMFLEYETGGVRKRLPFLKKHPLPRFDGESKDDVEQVEMALPAEAIRADSLQIVVENVALGEETGNVFLNEIWLRDGRSPALLPATLTPVSYQPRPRRTYRADLFATDPVGKLVKPGDRYIAPDQFYIDVAGNDPFEALEQYALRVREAQPIELSMYDFPTVCLWYASDNRYGGGGDSQADNTTLGAVEEMKRIVDSGFLNYSRAAVRLVPDSYMPDNHQGWWDDKHWQREDTDRDTTQNGRYVEPYETTEKWGRAVTELGGIPLTYFQTSYRSEDYAKEFPSHMLFNERYAWKGEPVDTEGEMFTTWETAWTRNGRLVWGYDFTDPDFLDHMHTVYANLKRGGVRGLMFDYPASGWARAGGMEDEESTTASAYRTIFRLAHDGLGPESYVHERNMERGSDITLGLVASMRTENDTDKMDAATVTRCGLRWYKNRVVVNQDADAKNLVSLEGNRDRVRAMLTMCYVTTGRMLLANSISQISAEIFHDLTRSFPYHTAPRSARPVDAFVSEQPQVFDFEVTPQWHQVTFFNPDPDKPRGVGIDMAGEQVDGALGLKPDRKYHVFDFWNQRYLGEIAGRGRLEQSLRPGEARMMSVREKLLRPQVISTNRHLMQGFLDLSDIRWDADARILRGVSQVVAKDPYRVSLALNNHRALGVRVDGKKVAAELLTSQDGVVEFVLKSTENAKVEWSVTFDG